MKNIPNFGDDEVVDQGGGNNIELLRSNLEKIPFDEYITSLTSNEEKELSIHVRCEPVIEILSAKVFIDNAHTSFNVYGDIRICNSVDLRLCTFSACKDFIIYDRHPVDSPQCIYPKHNLLQLSGPQKITTLEHPLIFVDINNVNTGAVVAFGQKPLRLPIPPFYGNRFETLDTVRFSDSLFRCLAGDEALVDTGNYVELQYMAFAFGVYAQIQIFLYKDDDGFESKKKNKDEDDDEEGVEIFGVVRARCNPLVLPEKCYKNDLFNVIKEEYVCVGLGTEIDLSKSLVVVPAYSELEIEVNLTRYEDEFIVQGSVCFEPTNYNGGEKDIRGVNGFYVRVHVTWQEPSLLNKHWCDKDKINRFCYVPQHPRLCASQLVEVFSLFIARPNGEEVKLYGSVKIFDSRGCCDIFSCSKNEAYFLSRGCNFLPMHGPKRAVTPGMVFSIKIDLIDIDGHVKIKGFVHSTVEIEERQRPWFDRPLCSVVGVANKKSFAAVNYTLFSFAVQASVTVHLVSKCRSSAHGKIYGDISAFYDKLPPFSIKSNRDFFQRVLFTRKQANPLEVGENLELSRNLLAVPMESSYFMAVMLFFMTSDGYHDHVRQIRELRIGEPYIAIRSDYFDICIDVQWRGLPFDICLT